jgi:signal transduction histidine kinase
VYGHGLVLLVLVTVAVAAAGWALGRALPAREPERLASYVAARMGELAGEPARLRAELQRVREAFGLEISVYGPGDQLLASNIEPALPPGKLDEPRSSRSPFHLSGRGFTFAAALPGGQGHLVVTAPPREGLLTRLAVFIAVVLLALALGSIPLARSISSPVERLTVAARALGAGDLTIRSGVRGPGEVGELAVAFDDMAGRLERLVKGEKELIANVSHELRTPLTRIRVALALAEEGDVARARQALGEIGEDLAELERLVEEILAAARLDLGGPDRLPLHLERVPPAALLGDAAQRFRARQPERTLTVVLAPDLPDLEADPALLRRLLGNLLDNAAKYSDPATPVALSARGEGNRLVVEVSDQGIGIDPADLPRLFTPFFRTDRSRARGTGGVGLGLALARRIAEAHGGELTAESQPGRGSRFRATLPAA